MDKQDPEFQRRAIFQGLAPFLKRPELFQSLWAWQEKHAKSDQSMNVFVQEVCERYGIAEQRNDVYKNIVRAMQHDADQLGPDPLTEMMQYRAKAQPSGDKNEESVPPATAVFCNVLVEFFDSIAMESIDLANRCKTYLSRNLKQVVEGRELDALVSWLLYPRIPLNRQIDTEALRGMMHISYIGACEYLGPVKADRYLSQAIKKAEMMSEAVYFSPRQLL